VGDPFRRPLARRLGVALLALLSPVLLGQAEPARPTRVYGIEVDVFGERERVLVFAERPVEGRLEERDPETLVVVIPGAVLDASAPARVAGTPAGGVRLVSSAEVAAAGGRQVRLTISRTPGPPAELTQRGATLAVELPRPRRPRAEGVAMKFLDVELSEVVRKVADATGQRFVFDDSLQGVVTLTSPELVSPDEALELLHVALLVSGFAAVPAPSGALKILPMGQGMPAAEFRPESPEGRSEAPMVTLLHLRDADAEQVSMLLKPWIGSTALAIPHSASNALILAGSEARLRALLAMVSAIDQSSDEQIVVRRLRNRSAAEAAELVLSALGAEREGLPGVEAWPDERTGALVLRAPPEQMEAARAFLEEIDRPAIGRGRVAVIPMRWADPDSLAQLLTGLAAGGPAPETGAEAAVAGSLEGRQFTATAYPPTHALLVSGDPDTLGVVAEVVDQLDRPPVIVNVELVVLQVIYDASLDLGFDAFIPLSDPNSPDDWIASFLANPSGGGLFQPGSGTGPAYAARFTRAPLVIPFVDSDGDPASLIVPRASAVLTANDGRVNSTQLLRPQLRMLAGEEQEIFAGNNIPVSVSRAAPASTTQTGAPTSPAPVSTANPLTISQNVERQDVGVRLRVKPTVGEAGGVRLELDVDVTSLAPSLAGDVDEVGPTIRQRRLTSIIHLDDGEFAVVGFAREPVYEDTATGIPWLMKVPVLGWAFRTSNQRSVNARLVIAAQARLERTPEESLADSVRQRLAFERSSARFEHFPTGAPTTWALRAAALADRAEAEAIAARLSTDARPARVTRWESSGGPVFDVTLFGFPTLPDANETALALREEGWNPEIVVLPVEAH
jgi:general secretion pathway protein D